MDGIEQRWLYWETNYGHVLVYNVHRTKVDKIEQCKNVTIHVCINYSGTSCVIRSGLSERWLSTNSASINSAVTVHPHIQLFIYKSIPLKWYLYPSVGSVFLTYSFSPLKSTSLWSTTRQTGILSYSQGDWLTMINNWKINIFISNVISIMTILFQIYDIQLLVIASWDLSNWFTERSIILVSSYDNI